MKKGQFLLWTGTWLPFLMLLTIIMFFYGVYLKVFIGIIKTYLLPLLNAEYQVKPILNLNTYLIQLVQINDMMFSGKVIGLTTTLHTLLFLLIITLIRVVFILPGNVPNEWLIKVNQEIHNYIQNEENMMKKGSQTSTSFSSEIDEEQRVQLNIRAKLELIEKQGKRFCKNCQSFKPKRCHHCRQCKSCWLKMDHHCQWLNNCIGYGNYKLFLNLLSYGWALLGFIVITYSRCYSDTMNSYQTDQKLFLVSFTFLFSILLWILLTAFTIFHIWAITQNTTTLEYCENKPKNITPQNALLNFVEVFGKNPVIWFIPIQPSTEPILD